MRKFNEKLGWIFEHSNDEIYVFDLKSLKILYANEKVRLGLGYSLEELQKLTIKESNLKIDEASFQEILKPLISGEENIITYETSYQEKGENFYTIEVRLQAFKNENSYILLAMVYDVTERKKAEKELKITADVFDNTSEGIVITEGDSSKILQVNKAFCQISGYRNEELIGQKLNILKSGWHNDEYYKELWHSIKTTGFWQGEMWDRRKNGELYAQWLSITAVKDSFDRVTNYVGIVNEITERKKSEEKIYRLAYYDSLTNLPNRALFSDRVNYTINRTGKTNEKIAILYLDLDRFKVINDSFGHNVGDKLLQGVSLRLKEALGEVYTLSRLGGDEFIIMIENIKKEKEVAEIANKILESLSKPFNLMGIEVYTSISIGISLYPSDGSNLDTLLKNADTAMYRAKDLGRNNYQFYAREMNSKAIEKLKVENELRKALEKNELFLQYQPQVDLNSGKILGVEALIRWKHPEFGLVHPVEFIPLAEETGLIIPIGEWVLRSACEQYMCWKNQFGDFPKISLAVNLSARQFRQKNLTETIEKVIKETKFDAGCLELELTESVIMENVSESIKTLRKLKNMGIKIAIDDFGTGYSSLNYLRRFPLDKLKIDRSFVMDILKGRQDGAIVETIISMAHTLSLRVIAEGAETREQIIFLQEKGCDEVQGYYFSKPLSTRGIQKLINSNKIFCWQ